MKKVLSTLLATSLTISNFSPVLHVFANELPSNQLGIEESDKEVTEATIRSFMLNQYSNFDKYNEQYRVSKEDIRSFSNNGGCYFSSKLEQAFDGDLSTHWETGTPNSSSFTNEVVVEFNSPESINRMAYATRQDSAKGKGFPIEFEIYTSNSEEDDFELAVTGSHKMTGNMVQFQFDTITAKKIKFVFKSAHQNWASASEFWFYKEDALLDQMENLFTSDSKNELDETVDNIQKLNDLEAKASQHPFYEAFKEDFENARILLETEPVEYMNAMVSTFTAVDDERLSLYDELYKVSDEEITSITTNGGHYASSDITKAMDNDFDTRWHSGKQNNANFTNEVIITLDKLTTIGRLMYSNTRTRGFAQEFDIYISKTSQGDTFEKITSGQMKIDTENVIEILFNPVDARRIKFVFTKGYEDWAVASEFGIYKQDNLSEMMNRLFIDSAMSELNPEFATIEIIDSLMEAVDDHPFKEEYLSKLEIAKELITFGVIESGTSNVNRFTPFYTDYIDSYDEAYRVPISSISNNGGQYGSSAIKYAIDEDVTTHWETGKPNSSSFTNEVILTLEEASVIDRLTYHARMNKKGFPIRFSIYVSPVASGNNFQKVSEGGYSLTTDMLEIQFEAVKAKRVKFVFEEAYQDYAAIGDIRVYKKDDVSDQMKKLFTNALMDTVSEGYRSLEKLAILENEVSNHPLASVYLEEIQIAKDILNHELQTIKTVVAEQVGNRATHTSQNLKFGFGNNNYQPTGIVALAGQEITVYVDAKPGEPLPQLVFSQQEGSFASWARSVTLHIGKNVITVPEVNQNDGWYHYDVTPGGPVYILNPYTQQEQSQAPVIRFASGVEAFPMMDENTDEAQFLEFLVDYKTRLDQDKAAHPDVMDRKMIDVVEVVSDHLYFTGTASGAYEAYINQNFSPLQTVKMYNDHMDVIFDYFGFDESHEIHDVKYTRENIRLAQPFGYMYAAGTHIGVQGDVMVSMLTTVGGWGVDHEIGHRLDIAERTIGEVTNNMIPQYTSYYYDNLNKRIPFESHTYKNVIATDNNAYYSGGYFEQLAVFWQLEMIYPGYWARLNQLYRENNVVLDSTNSANDKLNQLAKYSSLALELDLTEHFERHGFYVSDETKEIVSQYEKPSIKTWYANYDYIEYEGDGFDEDVTVDVSLESSGDSLKLTFTVNDEAKNDVLGYEIFKDDQLIGFTSTNSFTDQSVSKEDGVNYTVIPYDKTLQPGQPASINTLTPTLLLQQSEYTIKLNESFNPMHLVHATNYLGEDIHSRVVVHGNVDATERGTYPIEFTIEDEGITVSKVMNVNVVSDYDYLSDLEWTSAKTQYGTIRKNESIKGRLYGDIKDFEKGIRIHANGTLVYDLSNQDYDYFEALLGVDMNIASQTKSSLKFIIKADGDVVLETDVLKHADDLIPVKLPVHDVEQLTIEVSDAGNTNTSDHSVIINPKLTTNNAKPTLNIPANTAVKVGESIEDVVGSYEAIDAEDGNLFEQVVVSGAEKVNFNRPGTYEINYRVTDSDGNQVEKSRIISVINMDDFDYLTDYEWKSAIQSYGSAKKDVSASSNPLRLTNEHGEIVTYDRGIGAHSTSTIIYDLTNKNYGFFTAYVGVDRQMYGSVGSVTFEVYVDGVKQFDSGRMNSKDPRQYVEVNVAGAKELKLVVTDAGNGNGSDHATWADTKLHYAKELNVDLTLLEEKLQEAEQINSNEFTHESYEALGLTIMEAESLLTREEVTQEEIDAMVEALSAAINNLIVLGDLTSLTELISKAQSIDAALYTVTSIQALQEVLNEADELVNSKNATESQVVKMADKLSKALENLVMLSEYEPLKELLEQVNELKVYLYSKESAAIIEELKEVLTEVLANDTLTSQQIQQQIDSTKNQLENLEFNQQKIELQKRLEEISDISFEDVVGTKHAEARWNNFIFVKNDLHSLLIDLESTDEAISQGLAMLDYTLGELFNN